MLRIMVRLLYRVADLPECVLMKRAMSATLCDLYRPVLYFCTSIAPYYRNFDEMACCNTTNLTSKLAVRDERRLDE